MKLSQVASFLQQLDSVTPRDLRTAHDLRMQQFMINACYHPIVDGQGLEQRLAQNREFLDQGFEQLDATFQDLKRSAQSHMDRLIEQARQQTQDWWTRGEYRFSQNPDCLKRRADLPPELTDQLRARVLKAQDWRWPAMIVRPGLESFIDDMVSFDPLYLVDTSLDLLKPALERFHPQYQNRLCCYSIDELSPDAMLARLPQGQFGMCFAFHYFNFRPMEVIDRWLSETWHLLRPGGQMLFTYNDCDRVHGIINSETNWMAYTPGSQIRSQALSLGFTVIDQCSDDRMSWIHLGKPGQLESQRGSQTLAKIITRSK